LRAADRSHIAAGAGADHDHVKVAFGHEILRRSEISLTLN
jgi:hypothetical protein